MALVVLLVYCINYEKKKTEITQAGLFLKASGVHTELKDEHREATHVTLQP